MVDTVVRFGVLEIADRVCVRIARDDAHSAALAVVVRTSSLWNIDARRDRCGQERLQANARCAKRAVELTGVIASGDIVVDSHGVTVAALIDASSLAMVSAIGSVCVSAGFCDA